VPEARFLIPCQAETDSGEGCEHGVAEPEGQCPDEDDFAPTGEAAFLPRTKKVEGVFGHGKAEPDDRAVDDPIQRIIKLALCEVEQSK